MPRHHTPRFTIPHTTPRHASPRHAIHHTPYALRRTPYALRFTLYAVRHTLYAIRRTPYALRRTSYALCRTPYALRRTTYTIRHTPSQFPSIWWMDGLDRVIAGPARQKPLHTTCRVQRVSQNNPYPGPQVSPSPSIYNPHPQPQVPLPRKQGAEAKGFTPQPKSMSRPWTTRPKPVARSDRRSSRGLQNKRFHLSGVQI